MPRKLVLADGAYQRIAGRAAQAGGRRCAAWPGAPWLIRDRAIPVVVSTHRVRWTVREFGGATADVALGRERRLQMPHLRDDLPAVSTVDERELVDEDAVDGAQS